MNGRRSFLGLLIGAVASLFGLRVGAAQPSSDKQPSRPSVEPAGRYIFRHNGSNWAEIRWEDTQLGNAILCLEMRDGQLLSLDVWKVTKAHTDGDPGVKHITSLLPQAIGDASRSVQVVVIPRDVMLLPTGTDSLDFSELGA